MKQLLENWNNFLNEAIDPRIQKQIDAILALPDIGVLVSSDWDGSMAFRYIRIVDKDRKRYSILTSRNTDVPNGYIEIYDASSKKAKHLSGGVRVWAVGLLSVRLRQQALDHFYTSWRLNGLHKMEQDSHLTAPLFQLTLVEFGQNT